MSPARRAIESYSAVSSAWRTRSRLGAAAAPLPLRGQRSVEAGPVHPHAVLGGELDRQVDREAVGVVEPERHLAGQHRRVGRQVLRAAPNHAAPRR